MKKFTKVMLGLIVAAGLSMTAQAEHVVVNTPANFQVLSISPNAKWACGVFITYAGDTQPFRWNLEGGSIEIIGGLTAWDVANDGTVSGDFMDNTALASGAGLSMPGYWRDGRWHSVELPEGAVPSDGCGCCISPDGHYMSGAIAINGIYKGFVWKDGKLHRSLTSVSHAMPMAVSPDGQYAAGWNQLYNRAACIWKPDGTVENFLDSPEYSQSPWNYARNFSPDGKRLVYWGGWEIDEEGQQWLWSWYDVENGTRHRVKVENQESDLEFYDIANNGMLVGSDRGRGSIWVDDERYFLDDYLKKLGVDISNFEDFYSGTDYYVGQLPISRVVATNAEGNVLACNYYNKEGLSASLVIKIDDDFNHKAPAEVKVAQLAGINTVGITWKRPVGVQTVRGYNVYRDGKKINGLLPINVPYYYDKNLSDGTYEYVVATVNNAGEETRSEALSVEVNSDYTQAPAAVSARQKGYSGAHIQWNAPLSNLAHKNHFASEAPNFEGFSIYEPMEVEMAVSFDKAEMNAYRNYKITEVSFMPMAEHRRWTVNLYTRDSAGKLNLLVSKPVTQKLNYRALNTVKFDIPVAIPADELIVAIDVLTANGTYQVIGADSHNVVAGRSDLLRQKTDPDFFSIYESSIESAMQISNVTWSIDLGLTPDGYSESDNALAQYNIFVNGEQHGSTTDTYYNIPSLATGNYEVGVEAVYANGAASSLAQGTLNVNAKFPSIDDINITSDPVKETTVNLEWAAPIDNDLTDLSYSTASTHATGIKGVQSNGYAIMVAADFPSSRMKGFDGYAFKTFRFYPLADALFTFLLYENEKLIAEVEVDDFKLGRWNEVELPEEVIVNGQSSYRLVLDCFDPEPDTPLMAIDNQTPRANVSDLYSIDNGETWESLTIETGSHGNWMIGFKVVDKNATNDYADGYDVLIDNTVRNEEKLTKPSFTFSFPEFDTKLHSARIYTYYALKADVVKGKINTFRLSTAGVEDSMIADITLAQGENYLQADGTGVEGIEVYSLTGACVATSNTNRVNISGLSSGLYMVNIKANGKTVSHKVNIRH